MPGLKISTALVTMAAVFVCSSAAYGADQKTFTLAISPYAGWMPWYYAEQEKILDKWAKHFGVSIKVEAMDYVPSIERFVAGHADAVTITNIEALDIPAASGVDSSIIILGDYSNGNDAVLARTKMSLSDLKDKKIYLAEKTVSQYLLSRALDAAKLKESDVHTVNVGEDDISQLSRKPETIVVTWNPLVHQISELPGAHILFSSAQIPNEIQDLVVVNSRVLASNPNLARALVSTWYEVMEKLSSTQGDNVIAQMAAIGREPTDTFKQELKGTAFFYTPESAVSYMESADLKTKQDLVRKFCFSHGLLGEGAKSVDAIGIQFPDGTVTGAKSNIKLRYVDNFTKELVPPKKNR
jgi:NitT/TauT family transport system substrate-binding protein